MKLEGAEMVVNVLDEPARPVADGGPSYLTFAVGDLVDPELLAWLAAPAGCFDLVLADMHDM
jgi:hypothetical protein